MPKPPTLAEILEHKGLSFQQLDCQCAKEHLIEIARDLTGWENVASFLGLRDTHEEDIRGQYPGKTRKQTEAMLLMWREEFGQKATYKVLMEAFLKVGKTSLVETTCDIFKSPLATHEDIPPVASIATQPSTAHLSTQQQLAGASPTLQSNTAAHDVQQLLPAIDDSVLTEEDIGDVLDAVIDLAGRWTGMCTALRLKSSAEEIIARQYFYNPGDCLKAVLRQWLHKDYDTVRHGLPTWRKLVEAVAKSAGGNNPDLAMKIAEKHLIKDLPTATPVSTHLHPDGLMSYGSPQEMPPQGGAIQSQYPPPGSQQLQPPYPPSQPHPPHSVLQWQGQPQTSVSPSMYQRPSIHTQPPPQYNYGTSATNVYVTGSQFGQAVQGAGGVTQHSYAHHQPEVPANQQITVPAGQPTLPELIKFPGQRGRINIPQEISTHSRVFGILLLEDGTGARISAIRERCRNDPEKMNMDILEQWLEGRGKQPVTWDTLVEVLKDTELNSLAQDIAAVKCSLNY